MMRSRLVLSMLLLALAGSLAGCEDPITPPEETPPVNESELTFLRFAEAAPALTATEVSFWAVKGDNREVEIHLRAPNGDEEDFLEFRVPGNALLRAPDGRAYQKGDSVRITIRVVDPTIFNFQFEPTGLVFDPNHPARLRVSYDHADPDHDGDGEIGDEDDRRTRQRFGFWHQKTVGRPWHKIATLRVDDMEDVEADILGFSRYAVASD